MSGRHSFRELTKEFSPARRRRIDIRLNSCLAGRSPEYSFSIDSQVNARSFSRKY